ncbi:MAG: hypothetical protein KatS3mg108_0085 [Isosphaeraceae bacterium]|nr:MAG: hypothetical protein KatS3mg108_0085 [Isosphaeraceae bacterium]
MNRLGTFTRRRWLAAAAAGGLAAAGGGVGLYTWKIEPHWVAVEHRTMPLEGLPPAWRGRRLVQVSDLHVGPRVDSDYLIRSLRAVGSLEPDMVAITGDLMSCVGHEQIDETARVLEALPRPPFGVFASLGNHDYTTGGWKRGDVADALVRRLADLGITTLRNEARELGGLRLIGLDDLWASRFDPAAVGEAVRQPGPRIVLCHNPDAVDRPGWSGYQGWILAGHTHGGQCVPPFLPPPILPVQNKRYSSGHIDLGDGRHLYINRGLGHLWPVRFNCRPEVTVFTLA